MNKLQPLSLKLQTREDKQTATVFRLTYSFKPHFVPLVFNFVLNI